MQRVRKIRATKTELAEVAHARLTRSVAAYRALADRWDTSSPVPLVAAADVALDAAIAVEAAIKAVVADLCMDATYRRWPDLLQALAELPSLPREIGPGNVTVRRSLDTVRAARDRYVHGGLPAADARELLSATRDAIRTVLFLASSYEVLRPLWPDAVEELWEFDGQPGHFARQVARAFSGQRFEGLRLRCAISRTIAESTLRLSGAISASCPIEQSRWGVNGEAGSLLQFPGVQAEVGVIRPPEAGGERTAEGEAVHTGTLKLVARGINAQVDGISAWGSPLAVPIYLRTGDDTSWMVGPGELRIDTLELSIPFCARSRWFVSPDRRQEVVTQFIEHDEPVLMSGKMRFHHIGHAGDPAYRGEATIEGVGMPCRSGLHIAEWTGVEIDEATRKLRSWTWGGVTRFRLVCDLALSVSFGSVEVFEV